MPLVTVSGKLGTVIQISPEREANKSHKCAGTKKMRASKGYKIKIAQVSTSMPTGRANNTEVVRATPRWSEKRWYTGPEVLAQPGTPPASPHRAPTLASVVLQQPGSTLSLRLIQRLLGHKFCLRYRVALVILEGLLNMSGNSFSRGEPPTSA